MPGLSRRLIQNELERAGNRLETNRKGWKKREKGRKRRFTAALCRWQEVSFGRLLRYNQL
jgi:hypothetical protein